MNPKAILWLGIIVMITLIVGAGLTFTQPQNAISTHTRTTVQRLSFELSLQERGRVYPARVVPIKSQIASNQAKLIWKIDEGNWVNKGLIIARFDTKPFMDNLFKAEQNLLDAQATLDAAEKSLLLQQEDEMEKIDSAEKKLAVAQNQAKDLRFGSGKLKRKKLQLKIAADTRQLAIARGELDDYELLLHDGHVSTRERDKVASQYITAKETLSISNAELENFDLYEWPKTLAEATIIVEAAENMIARAKRTAEIELARRRNDVARSSRKLQTTVQLLEKAKQEVAQCDVYSPINGRLLYKEVKKPEGQRKIQLGDSIWQGQTFMEIPDNREMVIEVEIREIDVAKLKSGMLAQVTLDAFPEQPVSAKIISIDSLVIGDQRNEHLNRFLVRFMLQDQPKHLQVGMSAGVEVHYKTASEVLAISPRFIHFEHATTWVWVEDSNQQSNRRDITLGSFGAEWVEVTSGLAEGEVILDRPHE